MIRYLISGTADVGRQQYIGASADAQVRLGGRLGIQHINDGPADGFLIQNPFQCGIVYDGRAPALDPQQNRFQTLATFR